MTYRYASPVGALLVAAAIGLAACGGGTDTASPGGASAEASGAESMEASAAPSVAESMEASAAPSVPSIDLGGAAGDISNLSSYQLDISIEGGSSGTQSMTIMATHDPVDATHYIMDDFELITIDGQGAWINQGGTWIAAPGGADSFMGLFDAMAPDTLISAYSLGLYGNEFVDAGNEQHNGVDTKHYHLDASDVSGPGSESFPSDGTMDLWVANDGGYLVGMQYAGTDPATGEHAQVSMEVSHVDDGSISIEPPI